MGFFIEDAEAEALIAELARLEGRSEEAVVADAVRERLVRLRDGDDFVESVLAIGADCAARMSPKFKALDHGDYLYDENGLPR